MQMSWSLFSLKILVRIQWCNQGDCPVAISNTWLFFLLLKKDTEKSALYLILIKENNRLFHSDRQQSNNTGHTSIFTFLTNENTVIKPIAVWLQKTAHGAVIIEWLPLQNPVLQSGRDCPVRSMPRVVAISTTKFHRSDRVAGKEHDLPEKHIYILNKWIP